MKLEREFRTVGKIPANLFSQPAMSRDDIAEEPRKR